jgi:hypothetical protein
MSILLATFYHFAQAYGCGAYGSGTEGTSSCVNGTTTSGGSLVNTGFVVIAVITAACLIIFTALVVRLWRNKKKQP